MTRIDDGQQQLASFLPPLKAVPVPREILVEGTTRYRWMLGGDGTKKTIWRRAGC